MYIHFNMQVFRMILPVVILLQWFTRKTTWPLTWIFICLLDSRCENQDVCNKKVPVVKVCTDDSVMSQRDVNIDAVSVPRLQTITCKCVISLFEVKDTFVFVHSGKTDPYTWFEINEEKVNGRHKAEIYDKADVSFNTNDTVEACLNVFTEGSPSIKTAIKCTRNENGTKFNITCLRNIIPTTTDHDLITSKTSSSGGLTSVTEVVVEPDRNHQSKPDIIIPVVSAAACVVCFAFVVALGVFCRRRSLANKQTSKTSTAVVEKEKEDDYYMTENPMYNATDAEPDKQNDEREYHYIEAENQGDGMPDCQYESIPDSPVTGQFPDKDLHYDYTTCASTKAKSAPVLANNVNQNKSENTKISEQESMCDTTYDRTDTAAVNKFLSVNDYHHINPAVSRKGVAIDT